MSRELNGETAAWGPTDYLLAQVVDRLAILSWQTGHKKGSKPPEPIRRPEHPRSPQVIERKEREARLAAMAAREIPRQRAARGLDDD